MVYARTLLFVSLGIFGLIYVATWFAAIREARADATRKDPAGQPAAPSFFETALGFVTNFFDTLGIGSYAPTTSIFKLKGLVPDERIPGTLTIGHTAPTVTQAFIVITLVTVAPVTLIGLIAAAVAGAWLGAGTVSSWPRRNIQIGMGVALLAAAGLFVLANLGIAPGGGEALGADERQRAHGSDADACSDDGAAREAEARPVDEAHGEGGGGHSGRRQDFG